MVDLGYPSDAAIRTINALSPYDKEHNHPEGWTQSVIDKIQLEIRRETPINPNHPVNIDRVLSDFSPDERAAWNWYQSEVLPADKWKNLVHDYEEKGGLKDDVAPPETFDPGKEYLPKPGSAFKPPEGVKTWSGADNTGGDLAVSHDAINFFIRNLGVVAGDGKGVLLDSRVVLEGVNPKPGGFARAELLRQRVVGSTTDPGLRGDTMALLAAVHTALFELQADLKTLLTTYDEAEDFNTLTSAGLDKVIDESSSKIDNLGEFGRANSIEGGTGGGSEPGDEKSGDKKSDD